MVLSGSPWWLYVTTGNHLQELLGLALLRQDPFQPLSPALDTFEEAISSSLSGCSFHYGGASSDTSLQLSEGLPHPRRLFHAL